MFKGNRTSFAILLPMPPASGEGVNNMLNMVTQQHYTVNESSLLRRTQPCRQIAFGLRFMIPSKELRHNLRLDTVF